MELTKKINYRDNIAGLMSKAGVYIVFAVLIIWFSSVNKRFLTVDNLLLILRQAAPIGIATIGMTFVMVTSGIDISLGRNMFFVSAIVSYMVGRGGMLPLSLFDTPIGYLLVILISIILGCLIGWINGELTARFHILPFIVTLSVGCILRGIGLWFTASATPSMVFFSPIANGRVFGIPVVIVLFAIALIVFDIVLKKTIFGRQIMAIGNSPNAALKAGINVRRTVILTYILCGALAAFGGILSAGQIGGVALSFGEGNEFTAISAAVIGGTSLFGGKARIIPGTIVGIVLITTIMNGLAMINASPYVYTIVRGLIIFAAVMLDSMHFKGYTK